MKRVSLLSVASAALVMIAVAKPAHAKTHKNTYAVPCSTLWPAVKDTLRNSGKYGIIGISNEEMTASYNIGGTLTQKRTNSVLLNTVPTGCEMQVQSAASGLMNNDAGDFKSRVDASLAKLKAAADAKPETTPTPPPPPPKN
jgi:hypothetical protein